MCRIKTEGVIMGVNFGYGGYGMMNGMNTMGMMPMQNTNSGNVCVEMKQKYGCEHCFQQGVVPYNYPGYVNPIPKKTVGPSFITRLINKFTGGQA